MTYFDAIQNDLFPFPVEDSVITRRCSKHQVDGDEAVANETLVSIMVVEILTQLLSLSSVSEAGISKSFDKDGIKLQIKRLCTENGLDCSKYVLESSVTRLE